MSKDVRRGENQSNHPTMTYKAQKQVKRPRRGKADTQKKEGNNISSCFLLKKRQNFTPKHPDNLKRKSTTVKLRATIKGRGRSRTDYCATVVLLRTLDDSVLATAEFFGDGGRDRSEDVRLGRSSPLRTRKSVRNRRWQMCDQLLAGIR
jgi:hypothetical protein